MNPTAKDIGEFIDQHQSFVIMQADNPDGDSLASALALEQILGELGKDPILYCGLNIPLHLRYLEGWDRVTSELPAKFDASIIVDTSAISLFGTLDKFGRRSLLEKRPCLVLDHHPVLPSIPFANIVWNKTAVATGEVIYELARKLDWPLTKMAMNMIVISILSDSLGLTSVGVTARSIHIIAELVEEGVSISELENMRRESGKKTPEILLYKAELIKRIEYHSKGRVATVTIPWEEIEKYSQDYNPSMLVIDEMRYVTGVDVGIAFKLYRDGKVTAKIRSNYGKAIAGSLALHFGGGGHAYASGFKISDGRPFEKVKADTIAWAEHLLDAKEERAAKK